MEANLKMIFGIRGFDTHESLSSHTTFRPIKSGATVPLNAKCMYLQKSEVGQQTFLKVCES
jgi:hypothetical protein